MNMQDQQPSSEQDSGSVAELSELLPLKKAVEAIIFAAEEPLDIETIEKRIGTSSGIKKILYNK